MENETSTGRGLRLRVGLGAGVVLVLVLAGVAVLVSALAPHGSTATAAPPSTRTRVVHTADPTAADSPTAFVHVVGQVARPGLYELPAGSRVVDAVAAAGGFTTSADQAQLNLAQVIEDGQQIVVLAQGAVPATSAGQAGAGATVNINTADTTALETLDGIGPSLAQRILDYRTAHGGFRTVNDLQNVPGIGPKKFAAIKAKVRT
ncbi:MAG: competence protein ComEA [Actinomycetota bacterium]|nr:competence protein ComEA [Actinomycetota bacterium]